jgi:hypothetical protein
MIGCYDFCGHYEWTFEWFRQQGGESLVGEYWDMAIAHDSQIHAAALIGAQGIEGMKQYWGHTLDHEAAGYAITATDEVFRIDMHVCPSKGFLIRNGLAQYHDYCSHCIGWLGPLMKDAGFVIHHEHNHCGKCWWEMRRKDDLTPPSETGKLSGEHDVRMSEDWKTTIAIDVFKRTTDSGGKTTTVADCGW